MQYMLDASANMVILGREEHLGFMFQPAKREGMNYRGLIAEVWSAKVLFPRVFPLPVKGNIKGIPWKFHYLTPECIGERFKAFYV